MGRQPFNLMAKPSGAACNLDCAYCFYLEKEALYPQVKRPRMSRAVVEALVDQVLATQPGPEVVFPWQGGEPTLMGLDFFREVVRIQAERCPPGWTLRNTLQTNGALLDDDWCAWLAEHDVLVGLSIDGPRRLHDRYRVDKGGQPTFDRVMAAARRLRRHGVEFNTLTVVSDAVSAHPLEVYRFLRDEVGSSFLQLIPLVERVGPDGGLAGPPTEPEDDPAAAVTPWSVRPEAWGTFLVQIFEEWSQRDLGRVHVQLFEEMLGKSLGQPATMCFFTERCGRALVVEHDGSVFSCDHFVYPEHRLGNLLDDDLGALLDSPAQRAFGAAKAETLPGQCLRCPVQAACQGECPKRRFLRTADGEPGLNYLCAGYLRFLTHAGPTLSVLGRALQTGRAAEDVMAELQAQAAAAAAAGRNRPCPCGSGRKHKRCCGRAADPAR